MFKPLIEDERWHEWEFEQEPTLCENDEGVIRMAAFGPDYTLLVPAANRVLAADIQRRIGSFNIYFLCTRPRIIASENSSLASDVATIVFEVFHDDGSLESKEVSLPRPPNVQDLRVDARGSSVYWLLEHGETAQHDAALLAQALLRPDPWEPSVLDLEIRYIGRARGRLAETCALDRLEAHATYQAVLEEVLNSHHRNRDIWLILGSGTTLDMSVAASDPSHEQSTELKALNRARSILSKNRRIDVAEALLINYFKPPYNDQHTGQLDLGAKTFKFCYEAGLTGISVVTSARDWGIGLYSESIPARLDHSMTVCL